MGYFTTRLLDNHSFRSNIEENERKILRAYYLSTLFVVPGRLEIAERRYLGPTMRRVLIRGYI